MTKHIKDLLSTCMQTSNSWQHYLIQHWPTILGNIGTHVTLEKINGNTLTLGVSNSCWLQELYVLSPLLLHIINEKLDQPYITELRFKQAYIGTKPIQKTNPPLSNMRTITLSNEEQNALSRIQDIELRSALKTLLINCYQEK